jgi:imidazolonepropionase-like amidohydrolase
VTVTVHAADVVLTMTGEPLPGHAVVVENAVIAAIGPRSDFTHERIRDWPGVLLPGLVNAHTRLRFDDRVAAHQLLRNGTTTAGWVETLSGDDVDLLAPGPGGDAKSRIRAITVDAAQALGLDVGTLRVGGRADLAVFDVPPLDPYVSLITHGAGRCVATVMGGRLVHRR